MGLYDSYRLSNSNRVKEYQGSAVPELVQVSQEMQRWYDSAADTQDYMKRFMNSMQALTKDQPALQEWAKQHQDKIAELSKRKDLENTVRETTMLARDIPEGYSVFAKRMKQSAEYQTKLNEAVQKGEITSTTADRLMKASMFRDKGLTKDPMTGRYTGDFSGMNFVKNINLNERVDKYLKDRFPVEQGYSIENANGQWIVKNGSTSKVLTPDDVRSVIHTASQSDNELQDFLRQEADLSTYDIDYSKVNPTDAELAGDLNNYSISAALDKRNNFTGHFRMNNSKSPVKTAVDELLKRGYSVTDAMRIIRQQQVKDQNMQEMMNYGVTKYIRNDQKTEQGLEANQVWKWNDDAAEKKKENQMLQMATTMTLGGADVKSAGDFNKVVTGAKEGHTNALQAYSDWLKGVNDGKPKLRYADGRVVYKENGKEVDVTEDANSFRRQAEYAQQKITELDAIDKAARRASGFTITPALQKKAQQAYDEAYSETTSTSPGIGAAGKTWTEEQRKRNGQAAYDEVLKNIPAYKKYKEELTRRTTGTTMGSDLFVFRDKNVENISEQIQNVISGLGRKDGMVPVQGKDGKQLTADEWEGIKGSTKAVGVTYTDDPNSPVNLVVRVFKDVKDKKTAGEDMIVKLPNTNIQSIAEENMDAQQKDYLRRAAGLATSLNNTARAFKEGKVSIKANTDDPRAGWTVRVGNNESTLYSFKDILDYLDANNK